MSYELVLKILEKTLPFIIFFSISLFFSMKIYGPSEIVCSCPKEESGINSNSRTSFFILAEGEGLEPPIPT